MRNHDQKTRNMARSILPSKARVRARERKVASARRARARNTARLVRMRCYLDDLDGFDEDLNRYDLDDTGWDGTVDHRRDADKVSPLMRWAEMRIEHDATLRGADYDARRCYFAGLLGDTVSGRHALQHLDELLGVENPWLYGRGPDWVPHEERNQRARAEARVLRDRRVRMLADVVEGAGPLRLNARIRALTPPRQQHWAYDEYGLRSPTPDTGNDPWVFGGDVDAWLVPPRPTGCSHGRQRNEAQEIAFEALDQVYAEMFATSLE